ncbi:MAG: ATP-binding protein [Symploca sp. SIO2E6]|nr:ATP-binding protein [Symploca sp. SIO2E6]
MNISMGWYVSLMLCLGRWGEMGRWDILRKNSLTPVVTPLLSPSHQALANQLRDAWELAEFPLPFLQLCGGDDAAKLDIVNVLCYGLDYDFGILSTALLPSSSQELYQLQLRWEREALLNQRLLFLDCQPLSFADNARATAIHFWIEGLNTPVILSSLERLNLPHRTVTSFDVLPLSFPEKMSLWSRHLGDNAHFLNGKMTQLSYQFNLNPSMIEAACTQALVKDQESLGSFLWTFCRTQARPRLDDLAQRLETTAVWSDLVLPEPQYEILTEIATQLQHQSKVYHEWGFANKSDRGLGLCAMFHGASGTGKTMAAEVLAGQLNLDLYRIDLSVIVSKYIGETEKNLRRIFDAAAVGGAILLFDEADALFGKRTEVNDSRDRHANVEVSYLLQRMEAYQGLAILTTNLKKSLDKAFLRRIRFQVEFPFPNATNREEIWQRVFPPQTPTQDLDYKKLSKLQVAGGHIRNIALNAAFYAAGSEEPVKMKHLHQAAKREYLKMEKILTADEVKGWV